jgi:hypothetical protein
MTLLKAGLIPASFGSNVQFHARDALFEVASSRFGFGIFCIYGTQAFRRGWLVVSDILWCGMAERPLTSAGVGAENGPESVHIDSLRYRQM